MLAIFILTILSCSINSIWTATPFKDCGSKLGSIQLFEVSGCTTAPCKFSKGKTYSMNLTFQATTPSKTASVSIHGIIAGVPVPFPLPESNACKLNVKCPINQNDNNVASLSLPVLPSYPSISLYVKVEVKADDQNQDYACLEFPVTIISGSGQQRNLVGWKKANYSKCLIKT